MLPFYFSVIFQPCVFPVKTTVKEAPLVDTVPFEDDPNIFLPLGFMVKALLPKLSATSRILISSPTAGPDGKVSVIVLLVVSMKSFCPEKAFAVAAVIADATQPELVVCRGYQFVPSVASKILAKHDENYMPPEVKEALK